MTNLKNYLTIVGITIFILLLIEFLSWSSLEPDQRHTFLINTKSQEFPLKVTHPAYELRDIHLGWTYPNSKNGITTLEPLSLASTPDSKPLVIATLGGSTTDLNFDPNNWPYWLKEFIEEKGHQVLIHSAGVAGYNSSKELLKMLRDILTLKPDIIISLSGINEFFQHIEGFPFTNEYELHVSENRPTFLFPNISALLQTTILTQEKVSLGVYNNNSAAQHWINNMRNMKAIADEHEIIFIPILQGALGTADRSFTQKEYKLMEEKIDAYNYKYATAHYKEVRSQLENHPYINDFSQFFLDNDHYLIDLCHVTTEGNQELARRIANLVFETAFFKPLL